MVGSGRSPLPGLPTVSSLPHLAFPCACEGRKREKKGEERGTLFFPFYKATEPIGLGSNSYDAFNLNDLLKALSANIVTSEVRASTYGFGVGDTTQSIAKTLL